MNNARKLQVLAIAVAIAASTALTAQDSFAAPRTARTTRHSAVSVLKAKVSSALMGIRSFLQGVDEQWDSPSARIFTKK